ncbi:hypothetical protein [Arthrobacter sp. L77]|uniref:hypothetical protein n=1 Tax=Arthrobacter sp. L77 TaxID=1496689 RepID=UPI0005BD912C|nr:hypothetical protein [Arthrobacter sp. L77]
MSRVLFRPVLAGSILLALTACGGGGTPSGEPAPTAGSVETAPAASSSPAEVDPGTYSSEDLAEILATITTPDGSPLTIVPPDQVSAALGQATLLMDGVTITPSECDVVPQDFAKLAGDAETAIGVAPAADGLSAVSASIAVADGVEDRLAENAEKELALVSTCSTYQIEMQGVIVRGTMESAGTGMEGSTSFGIRNSIVLPDGQQQNNTTVTAARGDLLVTVTSQVTGSPSASSAVLEQLAGRVLAAAEG